MNLPCLSVEDIDVKDAVAVKLSLARVQTVRALIAETGIHHWDLVVQGVGGSGIGVARLPPNVKLRGIASLFLVEGNSWGCMLAFLSDH